MGDAPPFVGVAVIVTFVPVQTVFEGEAEIVTLGTLTVDTLSVIPVLVVV